MNNKELVMKTLNLHSRRKIITAVASLTVATVVAVGALCFQTSNAEAIATPAPQAVPVSVATVVESDVATWNNFSGRLEAVERVAIRSRVAGAVESVHFVEGALVKKGDLLITIDPAPFAAEVARLEALVAAAQARSIYTTSEHKRYEQLAKKQLVAVREVDERLNARNEADANLLAAKAALQTARLNLGYTQLRAPVSGRVGKLDVTVGNLVSAGPDAPALTSLVSVDPIYASFDADEAVVTQALKSIASRAEINRIPVQLTIGEDAVVHNGHLQLVDNQVDARSGTVRIRAVFNNPDGQLMAGQFARVRMGQATKDTGILINERAVGIDQNKKFVLVVNAENKTEYREVVLGTAIDGLRVVNSGLKAGERIVVNGLQRVRPGDIVQPQAVVMNNKSELKEMRL
jgi:multidrug efflux system membrane fusion protein